MLTVAKVTSGQAAGYADYLDGRSQPTGLGDYYLKDGARVEAPGRWVGGARAVGCDPDRPVTGDQLRALLAVCRPDTGAALRRVGGNGEAVAAIDATFSAPKSVSAVWALGSPELRERVERAHEHAIDRALSYAIEHAPMIRERLDSHTVIHTRPAEVIATSWRHTTARAVDERPPDPQLHSHVLLHAAVRGDGRVVAIDSRLWLVHGRELGAAYRTELAHQLALAGFEIRRGTGRGGRYFELDGVPAGLVDRWSSRHHQVRAAINARLQEQETGLIQSVAAGGPDSDTASARLKALRRSQQLAPAEDRLMATSTRAGKAGLATHGDLDRHWSRTARTFQFDGRTVEQHQTITTTRPLPVAEGHELLARLVEFDATFKDREARAVALEASAGSPIETALAALDQLRADGHVLALVDGSSTTRRHRATERQTVATAGRLAAGWVTPIPAEAVERHATALDTKLQMNGAALAREQRSALELACSDCQLVLIEGQAGTGKSTTLMGVALAHQDDGRQIMVTSTAGLAAQRLANELVDAGVDASSYSTAGLHAAVQTGHVVLGPRTTVIHDEAALASTREQHQLLHAVEASGARLIEVGDPAQSQAVGASGLWPQLEQAARINHAHVELTQNVRAHDLADRRDQQRFRDGQHERALLGYHARGHVTVADDRRHAEDAALENAHADRDAGKRTMVIAQTSNERLDELNARAQAIRVQHGKLGERSLPVPGRPYRLHPGDEIQIRHTLNHLQHGPLRNGQTANVIDANHSDGRLTLELQDGRKVALDQAQIARADVRLAYVQHPFPAQGQTTDTTHVIVAEHTTAEGSYVALTRARDTTRIYASREQLKSETELDQLQVLADRMSRTEPEMPSIHTPLAHEDTITTDHDETITRGIRNNDAPAERDPGDRHHRQHHNSDEHVLAVLGPQPDRNDPSRKTWQRAASAIEHYRNRYAIDDLSALGPEPPTGAFQQRHDRRQTAEQVLDALDQLDRHVHRHGPLDQRIANTPGVTNDQPERDCTIGWEP